MAQETTLYGKDLYGEKKLPELLRRLSADIRDPVDPSPVLLSGGDHRRADRDHQRMKRRSATIWTSRSSTPATPILKRMGRRTNNKEIRELVAKLRGEIPDIALRTTLISGFPGETEEDHEILMQFVDDMEFDRLGVFAYSPEEDTPAIQL